MALFLCSWAVCWILIPIKYIVILSFGLIVYHYCTVDKMLDESVTTQTAYILLKQERKRLLRIQPSLLFKFLLFFNEVLNQYVAEV